MANSYSDLQKQIEALQAEAQRIKRQEAADVIARIKEAIKVYGLTAADLGLGAGKRGRPGPPKASVEVTAAGPKLGMRKAKADSGAKYRDEQGQTWVGRGPRPKWLRDALANGKTLQDFAV